LSLYLEFLDTIVDSNGLDVAFNEFFLTITLDKAALTDLSIPDTYNFECNLFSWWLASEI